jgi:hypothetical protein
MDLHSTPVEHYFYMVGSDQTTDKAGQLVDN